MPDYAKLARTTQRLVEAAGRPLTLRVVETAPADGSKPWRGPGAAPPAVEEEVTGVVLDFKLTADTSEFIRRGDKRALIAARSTTTDLTLVTQLVDGSDVWKIERVELVAPGVTRLLWKLHLKR